MRSVPVVKPLGVILIVNLLRMTMNGIGELAYSPSQYAASTCGHPHSFVASHVPKYTHASVTTIASVLSENLGRHKRFAFLLILAILVFCHIF